MKFRVIRTDERREPHFAVRDIPDREVPFRPPLNPTGTMTDFGAVTAMFVFSVPPWTAMPAHNAPHNVCLHHPLGSGRGGHQRRQNTALLPQRRALLRRPYRGEACDLNHHRHGRGIRCQVYLSWENDRWR